MNNESNSINFSRPPYDFVCDYLRKSLTTAMLLLDSSGVIIEANSFICQQLFQENLVGTNIRDLLKPDKHSLFDPGSPVSVSPQVLSFERQGYGPLLLFSHVYPEDNGCLVIGEQARLSDDQILRKMSLLNNELTTLSRDALHESRLKEIDKKNLQEQEVRLNTKVSESEQKFRLLADYTHDWEYWLNPEGKYIYVSPACEKTTGYRPDEFISNPKLIFDLVRPDYAQKVHHHYTDENDPDASFRTMEFPIRTKTGEERWLEHHCSPVFDDHGNYAGRRGNNRDITERKKAEQERQELENQLHQKYKMEAVGIMAGGMAHNFNNNLSIILGSIELSLIKMPPDAKIDGYLNNAKTAVLRSSDLVKKILTFSRQGVKSNASIQLSLVINETLKLFRSTMPTTMNLKQHISSDSQELMVQVDTSQVQECLINLLNNAMHAMDEEGDLTVTLEQVELQQHDIPAHYDCHPGHYAKLSVQDSGTGMSAETIDKIFDLFFTTKPVDQGTGVGLSTVQGIVAEHGGMINVNSTLGEGSTFELYFPTVQETQSSSTSPTNTEIPSGTGHILLVDDDPMLATLGERMLETKGYTVTTMTDSVEALKLFTVNAERIDLLITDQTMPGLTGEHLIEEIKKIKPTIPTIICTGYSSKMDEKKAAQLGASAFLMKPLDMPKLLQTVKRVLDGKTPN